MKFSRKAALPLLVAVFLFVASCSRIAGPETTPTNSPGSIKSSSPPFPTREPERYRATRVITTTRNGADTQVVTTRIARDGINRREEHQAATGITVYLENADGSFIVDPLQKLYAQINDTGNKDGLPASSEGLDSPTLDQVRGEATYELLGTEQVGDRKTTKYRVTYGGAVKTGTQVETFIWIDESLGMPIRSETKSGEAGDRTTVLMELRESTTEVDPQLFRLAGDYRRVDVKTVGTGRSRAARQ